ncbi:MAG TPA: acyltransferase [Stenomitos sp.]
MSQRVEALDSVRGLAALVVVLGHLLYVSDRFNPVRALVFRGHASVILFFILSGFVLSLPYLNGRAKPYSEFVVRRICRIYLPYLCAIVLALGCYRAFARSSVPGLSNWFAAVWSTPPTPDLVWAHLSFLGSYPHDAFNPVIWSLIHELRLSLVFPLLVTWVLKRDWKVAFGIALGVSGLSLLLPSVLNGPWSGNDFWDSLHYGLMFVIGILLARHRLELVGMFQRLGKARAWGVVGLGLLLYQYSDLLCKLTDTKLRMLSDWPVALGASILLIWTLASPGLQGLLMRAPLQYLGRISYSLYLLHAVVLFSLVHALYQGQHLPAILLASLVLSFGVATLSYHLVEKPSIRLGGYLAGQFRKLRLSLSAPALGEGS